MNYFKIKKYDIANGKGLRTSLFVSGCNFECPGCFNRDAWDFRAGRPFDTETKRYLFELLSDPQCKGLSVLGGEPLKQGRDLLRLLQEVKNEFPEKDIWLWTGYYLDEMNKEQREIISYCNYVVDGRYIAESGGKHYLFKGSSNQTIWERLNGEWVRSKYND